MSSKKENFRIFVVTWNNYNYMSYKYQDWADFQNIETMKKCVLRTLSRFANDKGRCFPSIQTIMEMSGMSRESVFRHLKNLIADGLIEKISRTIPDSNKTSSNEYQLNYDVHIEYHSDLEETWIKIKQRDRIRGVRETPPISNTNTSLVNTSISLKKSKPKESLPKLLNRACQLPNDFSVSDSHRLSAEKNGWTNPEGEIEAFRDYHQARGTTMKDWDAAFRTWLRNAKKFTAEKKNNGNIRQTSKADICQQASSGAEQRLIAQLFPGLSLAEINS